MPMTDLLKGIDTVARDTTCVERVISLGAVCTVLIASTQQTVGAK